MSYRAPNTGDPELDLKLAHDDYVMLLPRLLEAPTGHGFACWLDKLTLIERPAIVAYVREHWDELDQERRAWAIRAPGPAHRLKVTPLYGATSKAKFPPSFPSPP